MDLGLQNSTALVLGGAGGLGSAIARTLASEQAAVAIADIDVTAAGGVAKAIAEKGGKALAINWDLGDLSHISKSVDEIEKRLGVVDILVAVTGGPPPGSILGQSSESWRTSFESMVLSIFAAAERVLPNMRARGWGRIISSTSSGVIAPIPNLGMSNAIRSSLVGWSKTLANEIGPDGITSNVVVPGRILTKRIAFLDEQRAKRESKSLDEVQSASIASIPARRYGDPQEYADVVTFLASRRASYVNGSIIRVDGGYIPSI